MTTIRFSTVVRLVIRVAGLLLMMYGGLILLATLPTMLTPSESKLWGLYLIYWPSLTAFFGAGLWFFAGRLTDLVVWSDERELRSGQAWASVLETIALRLMGVYIVINALVDGVYSYLQQRILVQSEQLTQLLHRFPEFSVKLASAACPIPRQMRRERNLNRAAGPQGEGRIARVKTVVILRFEGKRTRCAASLGEKPGASPYVNSLFSANSVITI